jgi:uncharacterized RDD family membrane protein YckC
MSKIIVKTSFNIDLSFETAAFYQRFVAWLIDIIIMGGYLLFMLFMFNLFNAFSGHSSSSDKSDWYNVSFLQLIIVSPIFVYHVLSELLLNGQSIGKKVMKIKVISDTGINASLDQYLLRWLLRIVDFSLSCYLIGFFTVIGNKQNKRLGDLVAGTLIVKTTQSYDLNDTVFREVESGYVPVYTNVLKLSDRDMNVIKSILDNSIKNDNIDLAERAADKIRQVLNITQYKHPFEFLETILKDYNYLANK